MPVIKTKEIPPTLSEQTGWMWSNKVDQITNDSLNSSYYPKISIVTPSLNQGQFLETAIRSVLLQGYPNLEYIIIDGGSNDKSESIIRKYAPWLAYWVSEPDKGQAYALNNGFEHASGDIYAYLNSDDYFEPGALYACASAYIEGHHWIVGRVRCWQAGYGYWPFPLLPGRGFSKWFMSCPIPQPGSFWSSKVHRKAGKFREDLNFIIDYEFWLRLRFVIKIKPVIIEQPIAVYRIHSESKTFAYRSAFTREGDPIREAYKCKLNRFQRVILWVAQRHRRSRNCGNKVLMQLKNGEHLAAIKSMLRLIAIWPLAVFDFHGLFLSLLSLKTSKPDSQTKAEIWPDWKDL